MLPRVARSPHLARDGYLVERGAGGESVWGLDPAQWICTTAVEELACGTCGHRVQVPREDEPGWRHCPCLRSACAGSYQPGAVRPPGRAGAMGRPHRLVAAEHTGLLDADTRHRVERSFMQGTASWDINLLSATPTLELGIDVGDLSSVLLCSVPPAQSNYLQRTGRAGRRDGNALTVTVANAHKHDLYFFADPPAMLAGEVLPPGVFLQATAVLERQLIAYCFDRWTASGIDESAIPGQLREVLDGVQAEAAERFPYTLLQFIERGRADILRSFLALFPDLAEDSREHLRDFLFGGGEQSGIGHRLTNRLHQLVDERRGLGARIDRLKAQQKRLEQQPRDEATQVELDGLLAERDALLALRRRINAKPALNFFTDEGLLPNYAFPEEGVTIHSVILRRLSQAQRDEEDKTRRYERINFEMQRPAHTALSELAPSSRFYAVGREVAIDQVDLSVSEQQDWRLCDRCHYAENLAESGDPHSVCPRCGSPQWSDTGRVRKLLRLRQVFATADDRRSRIGDDSDQRTPSFFNRQMLVDVPPGSATRAYRLASERLPFGFEYVPRMRLREINFGQPAPQAEEFAVAGELAARPGFQLCRHCGKVRRTERRRRHGFEHAYDCRLRRPGAVESDADYFDSLYLFRELESEAVRILLPLAEVGASGKRLHSLIAALSLGLRLYFRGNVDHIQVAHHSEPTAGESRKHYLVLFDGIPGGSGYLKELLRQRDNLIALLREAYEVIRRCECREVEGRDGCYRCILAYRESRRMDQISRQAAEEILAKILAEKDTLEPIEGLGEVAINALLESELEQRFIDALGSARDVTLTPQRVNTKPGFYLSLLPVGTPSDAGPQRAAAWKVEPQVKLGPGHGVAIQVKPDFVLWPVRESPDLLPVAVFADGFQYHYDKVHDDSLKRQALLDSGRFRVWSLGWHNLPIAGQKQMNPAAPFLEQHQWPRLFSALASQGGWKAHRDYTGFIAEGPFHWLLTYLRGAGEGLADLKHAALSRAAGWLDPRTVQDAGHRSAVLRELSEHFQGGLAAWMGESDGSPAVLGGVLEAAGPVDGIRAVARLPRPAMEDGARGDLDGLREQLSAHLWIDDRDAVQDKAYERRWGTFWGAANLLQFLPRLTLSSAAGVSQGIYPAWAPEPAHKAPSEAAPSPDEQAWQEAAGLSVLGQELLVLQRAGLPVPEVGVEVLGPSGEVIGELELAWRGARLGVVVELEPAAAREFATLGWTVLEGLGDDAVAELSKRLAGAGRSEESEA